MDCAQVAVTLSLLRFCGLQSLPRLIVEVGRADTPATAVWGEGGGGGGRGEGTSRSSKGAAEGLQVLCCDSLRFQLLGSR